MHGSSRLVSLAKFWMAVVMMLSLIASPIALAQETGEMDAVHPDESTIGGLRSEPTPDSELPPLATETVNAPAIPDEGTESVSDDVQAQPGESSAPGVDEGNLEVGDETEADPLPDQVETGDVPDSDVAEPGDVGQPGNEETTPESTSDTGAEPASPENQGVGNNDPDGVGTLTLTVVFEGDTAIAGQSCFEVRQNDTDVIKTGCLAAEDVIDGQGTVVFSQLPLGIYSVVASVVPDGWTFGGPVDQVIDGSGQDTPATMTAIAEPASLVEPAATTYQMIIEQRICAEAISGGDCVRHDVLADFSINFTITGPGPGDVQTVTVAIGGGGGSPPFSTGRIFIRNLAPGTYEVCGELVATHGTSTATLINLDGLCQTNTLPGDTGAGRTWVFHSQVDELTSTETGDLYITKYVCANADLAGTAEIVWMQPSNCGPPVTTGFNMDVQRNGVSVLPPGHDLLLDHATIEIGTYMLLEDGVPVGSFAISVWGRVLVVINYVELAAITVDPASGLAGSQSTVSGTNLLPGEQVSITFDGQELTTAASDGNGAFSVAITIPADAQNGPHEVVAKRPFNRLSGTTTFTVGLPAVELAVDPTSGGAGSQATVSGTNFQANEEVALTFAGNALTTTTADATGAISVSVIIPATAPAGVHEIVATGATSGQSGTTSFTVTLLDVELSIDPTSGVAGSQATVSGTNFQVNEEVALTFAGTALTTTTADASGAISVSITIPAAAPAGVHEIVATGATSGQTGSTTFTVGLPAVELAVNPTSGVAGSQATVSGTNFQANEEVALTFAGNALTTTTADASGAISVSVIIPATAPVGVHEIIATGATSGQSGTTSFTVTLLDVELSIDPVSGTAGSQATVSGTNFQANEEVALTFAGNALTTTTADASGAISVSVTIPAAAPVGVHEIIATGVTSGQSGTTSFTVTLLDVELSIDPTSGVAGSQATVSGTNFQVNEEVALTFAGNALTTTTANASGAISVSVTIPAAAPVGVHEIIATGATSGQSGTTSFTVTMLDVELFLDPEAGQAGVVVRFVGTGFVSGERVDIHFGGPDGRLVGYKTALADGSVGGAISIPAGTSAGSYQVVATGASGRQAVAMYEVEAPPLSFDLSSTSGPASVVVRFTGTGFVPGERVDIHFGGSDGRLVGYKTAQADGSIGGAILVPASSGVGAHQVVATGASGRQAIAMYDVEAPPLSFELNSTSGPAGAVVRFTGTGFVPGERVDIHFGGPDGRLVGYKTAQADGSIGGAILVPAGSGVGSHQVVATGASGRQADATYEVIGPTLSMNSSSGEAGSIARFAGSNFLPGDTVTIRFGGSNGLVVGRVAVSPSGTISGAITIPGTATSGDHTIMAMSSSGQRADATYEVIGPTFELTSTNGNAGVVVRFSGHDFEPGDTVTIRFGGSNGRVVGRVTVSPSGTISGGITIPAAATAGDHAIVASGISGGSAEATYTVTSIAQSTARLPVAVLHQRAFGWQVQ